MAFLAAFGELAPWALTQIPLMPSRTAPPYSSGSALRLSALNAPAASTAPSIRSGFFLSSSFSQWPTNRAVLSHAFNTAFPTNASVTITSARFENRSWPSMLPTKFRSVCLSNRCELRQRSARGGETSSRSCRCEPERAEVPRELDHLHLRRERHIN